jgi:hypothetical protein
MRKTLVFLVLAGVSYWGWANFGGFGDPVYSEIRVKFADTGIELFGLGKMNSEGDCQTRTEAIWKRTFSDEQRFEIASMRCVPAIPARYQELFANRPIQATYLSFERGNSGERDGRFVIYGVASSDVASVCPRLVEAAKRNYSGKVVCVQGTVG